MNNASRTVFFLTVTFLAIAACTTCGFAFSSRLEWDAASASNVAGYNVYRAIDNPDPSQLQFTKLTAQPLTGTAFVDSTMAENTSYVYVVTSVASDGTESDPSGALDLASGLRGDINGDHTVDATDSVILSNYLSGVLSSGDSQVDSTRRIDVDDDFEVCAADLTHLQSYLTFGSF